MGLGPDGIAVGPGAVWVANGQDGTVTRMDPVTGQPSGPFFVGAGPAGIAITPAGVWVANSLDLNVYRLDPATGRVTFIIPVGDGPSAIAAGRDGIWVSDQFNASLDLIDPHTNQVTRTVPVGSSPQGIAVAGPGVWVAARPFAAVSHRGGTLTEVTPYLPQRDPALAYDVVDVPALATVYDALVAFRRYGGAQGFTLVPDLASTLPRPADGGITYTFTLRRGIRYSNGTLVRASDFRRGIQRLLMIGSPTTYYDGIIGAQACHQQPRRCDLSAGIITNDAARTVTFHLAKADPDFLDKLALLFAVPAPPGTPSRAIDRAPFLPGTGPYMISKYQPNASLTLVRNRYFRQWSFAAQPAGYPNVIRFEQTTDPRKQQSAVAAGTADLVDITLNGQPYQDLAVQYPTRVYIGLRIATSYLFLNTRQPPFTNVKARQAINYAINRDLIIRLLNGGLGQDTVTCQILPAGLPSYQRYCPYTAAPKDGFWHGPDLAKARQLAKQSRTTNVPVTVWNIADNSGKRLGAYLVHLLRQLGYRATVRNVSAAQWYTAVTNSHRNIQMGAITAWLADFPTASDYFLPVLTCRSFYANPANTFNIAGYCNPHVDKLASEAQAAQLTNPAAARTLWARVDRIVTNQAPWVPISNTAPTVFVSARAGNYQESPYYGPLLDQIWVR